MRIEVDEPTSTDVILLLEEHLRSMHELSPPESVHALDVQALVAPGITFFTARSEGVLLACGALKEIDAAHGELKSMRTPATLRRRGAGRAMLAHLVGEARARGYGRLSLETGSAPAFLPAQKLYESAGFRRCGPFADYRPDPNSVFMTMVLSRPRALMNLHLVPPAERHRETFLRALGEFQREGLPWWIGGDLDLAERDFAAFVEVKLADASRRTETLVPKTHLWALADEDLVGRILIHHELNDARRASGGHVGYDTVPSFRGRGVATEMLRQALPVARALGLREVLLTCDDTNAASIRVIEINGGVLRETKVLDANRPPKRYYWIDLS